MEVQRIVLAPTGKWFIADPRKYTDQTEHWYCVHAGTVSQRNLERNLDWQNRSKVRGDLPVFVFEARTKTQVTEWLTANGYLTNYYGTRIFMNARDRRIRQAELAIERAQSEIDRVLRLPDEPVFPDDAPQVIYFQHRFNRNSPVYDYAAIKASDGLWYTTGPASPKGYTWDQLIDWHMSEVNVDSTVYIAKKFRPL